MPGSTVPQPIASPCDATSMNTRALGASASPGSHYSGSSRPTRATIRQNERAALATGLVRAGIRKEDLLPVDSRTLQGRLRQLCLSLLTHPAFDRSMGMVILANSACIGAEIQLGLDNQDKTFFEYSEHAFMLIYVGELFLRFNTTGLSCLEDAWVKSPRSTGRGRRRDGVRVQVRASRTRGSNPPGKSPRGEAALATCTQKGRRHTPGHFAAAPMPSTASSDFWAYVLWPLRGSRVSLCEV